MPVLWRATYSVVLVVACDFSAPMVGFYFSTRKLCFLGPLYLFPREEVLGQDGRWK